MPLGKYALDGRLHEVDEIAAGVFKDNGCDRSRTLGLIAKLYVARLKTLVIGDNVFGDESEGWDSRIEHGFLIITRRRKAHGFEDELDASDPIG